MLPNAAGRVRLTISPGAICFRCVGYLFQKVGKVAATSVGGGLLLLQVRFMIQGCNDRRKSCRRVNDNEVNLTPDVIYFVKKKKKNVSSVDSQPHRLHQSRLEESREGRQQGKEAAKARHQAGRPGAQHNGGQGKICCALCLSLSNSSVVGVVS